VFVYGLLIRKSPFISFDSVNMNGSRLAQIQSLTDFNRDVSMNTLPQYAHMSPDMLNDGHNTTLEYAATWSSSFLAPLLLNPRFMEKTLILFTYDESETYSIPNRIVSILLGGAIPTQLRGTTDDNVYTHYSILSTLENNWDLPNLGRYDVGANVFQFVADQTGYTNHPPSNLPLLNNSLSYGGFLNLDAEAYKPIPPPNLQLVGAGGVGVDASVQENWSDAAGEATPYDGSGDIYDGGNGESNENAPVYNAQGAAPKRTASLSTSKSFGTTMKLGSEVRLAGLGFAIFIVAGFVL